MLVFAMLLQVAAPAEIPPETPAAAPFWSVVRPDAVCSMSGTWAIGLGASDPNLTNVNVEFLSEGGKRMVQALHRGVLAEDPLHDLYLVDAATLFPIRTETTGPVPPVRFRFDPGPIAVKLDAAGAEEERIALSGIAIPEGPGLEIMTQAIPWADGLALSGTMLDRWRGTGQARNRQIVWRVEGRETRETLSGTHDLYRTRLAPVDGSFEIVAFVMVSKPHHIARFEYRPGRDRPALISELREAAFNCRGMTTPIDEA